MNQLTTIIESVGGLLSTKQFVWVDDYRAEARNGSGTLTGQYFSAGETLSSTNYYFTKDSLGSVREVTDATGAIQATYSYDAYGKLSLSTGTNSFDFQYAGYYAHTPSGLFLTRTRAYNASLGRFINRDAFGEANSPLEIDSAQARVIQNIFPASANEKFKTLIGSAQVSSLSLIPTKVPHAARSSHSLNSNLYAYVLNSPLNMNDPSGLQGADQFFPLLPPWLPCVGVVLAYTALGVGVGAAIGGLGGKGPGGAVIGGAIGGAIGAAVGIAVAIGCHCNEGE